MSDVGKPEIVTQKRVLKLMEKKLGYKPLGDLSDQVNTNIKEDILTSWLKGRGVSPKLISRVLSKCYETLALNGDRYLYQANKEFYKLLRYGVKIKDNEDEHTPTTWLIDWKDIEANNFYIAEEVTVQGKEKNKRPDIVIYINGIAIGVIELKRSSETILKGIRQNIVNQEKIFIQDFFSSMQLVMACNDTQGLMYGTIETTEKYYLSWKEENPEYNPKVDKKDKKFLSPYECEGGTTRLDCDILRFLNKERLLEILHDFILFDKGIKKIARQNQYFGVKALQDRVRKREGGIYWHTQGSGKSLSMVWLSKWIIENIEDARVLIVTDRKELDEQIEKVFVGVEESIYRIKPSSGTSGSAELLGTLNSSSESLMCTLVHKFGANEEKASKETDKYIKELKKSIPKDFKPKGDLYVLVDECHRTQSGLLHDAMKEILPNAMFIGFTGTPLLKENKETSIEKFGTFIHTYQFDEAVEDKVVLDLQYEPRDIEQYTGNQRKIDEWFEIATKGLNDVAKVQLKQKWGTMKKVLSSKDRLSTIVFDIVKDMKTRDRLIDGSGNAMLVCDEIYNACRIYEMFQETDLKGKCAIVTSYVPSIVDIKEESTEQDQKKYKVYRKMLAEHFDEDEEKAVNKIDEFEKEVKDRFINEPAQMKLLIVVDKLLTGFDAPSATYLYIDKRLRDHGLFQAICRVNRLDGEDKEYGYIIDYQDLFNQLKGSIEDYTSGAFEDFEAKDVEGLISNRLTKAKERLENARENVKALCEPVEEPKSIVNYQKYFVGLSDNKEAIKNNEAKRILLYKCVVALIRAYSNIANEYDLVGYSEKEIIEIREEVKHYEKVREEIKLSSGDYIDLKKYEPDMRQLIDKYVKADDSEVIVDFEEIGVLELLIKSRSEDFIKGMPKGFQENEEAMSEAIENNVRKLIIDEKSVNPKYYEKMSELLDELIKERKENAIEYKEYLKKIKELASKVYEPDENDDVEYPISIKGSLAKRALYDNLDNDEELTNKIDEIIERTKEDNWIGHPMKERKIFNSIAKETGLDDETIESLMDIIKKQHDYQ